MNETSLFIVVVLYNKGPHESSTLKSITKINRYLCKKLRLLIWNNSPNEYTLKEKNNLKDMLSFITYDYIYNGGQNIPLSKLYNDTIRKIKESESLLILDDDSVFETKFIYKAFEAIEIYKEIDLFLPIVLNDGKIVSPAKMVNFKGSYFKMIKPGMMSCKNITAINSGMIIRGRYLKGAFEGYDERIKFYFTDNDFMDRYRSSHDSLFLIDYKMHHTLDFYKKGEPFSVKSKRFKDLKHSFLILMRRKSLIMYLCTQIYLLIYSVKFSIKQRDIRFLFIN